MLPAHFLLLMLSAHLLLMMLSIQLLLMMLHIHLLLMMLSIHLLLMVHRILPMSGAFVLCSFFVHHGLVSFRVVIVAVKSFCLVFVPVFSGIHPFSLAAMFSHLPWLVFTLSRSSCACSANGLSALTLPSAFALACAFALVERLDRFLVRFPLARRSEEVFVFGCRLLATQLFRRGADFVGVGHRLSLFCVRLRLYSAISTVKARTVSVHVLGERIVDVGVVDHGLIHARHSGVVLEVVSLPSTAPVAVSGVAITVINASVKTDMGSPVTLVKRVRAVVPAPPSRCPK